MLRQPVRPGLFFMVNSLLVMVVSLSFSTHGGMGWVGLLALVVGASGMGLGAILFFKPATLTLAPDGLVFVNLGIRRSWRWSETSGFSLTHVRSGTVITFQNFSGKGGVTGRLYSLPARWTVPAADLVILLNRAQAKWR
jgi:hypothetical protein